MKTRLLSLSLLSLLPLLACTPKVLDSGLHVDDTEDDTATDSQDSDPDSDDSQDSDDTDDTNDTNDTDDTDDTGDELFSKLSWRLHEEMESLVWVSWEQDETTTVHVEYSFDDGIWQSSPAIEAEPGAHERLIVGIPFAMSAEWRLVADDSRSVDGAPITTGDLPEGLPIGTVDVSTPDRWLETGNYLLTSINELTGGWVPGEYWTIIIDRQARPVWAHLAPSSNWTLFSQVSLDGTHILWDEATKWSDWDDGAGSRVHRTYLDQEISIVDTPGLHHAFVQLPDDVLVWGSQYHGGGEALVERGPLDSDETVLWTCDDDWPDSGRGCESNGLFWTDTDTFLYSFYTNNSLVEVDHATGQSLWWAGQVRDGYDFDSTEERFRWQHGISYTDDGTLLVSTQTEDSTDVFEYEVDHSEEALHLVWSYDSGYYASTNGDAWRLENGNTLHVVGAAGHINEVTSAGEIVWHVDYDGTHLLGRGEFIEDLYALVAP